jgi:hypothetical protein
VKVVDVVEDATNHDTIVHVLEKEIGEPEGATVKVKMQQEGKRGRGRGEEEEGKRKRRRGEEEEERG